VKIKTDKFDKRFSKLIRTRDVVCQRCLRPGRTECSHIFGRRNKSLRWDTRNAKALCHKCHREWHENPAEAIEWLKGVIGEKNYDMLRLQANTVIKGPDKFMMEAIYQEMAEEIEYLESIPEENRMHLQFRNRYKSSKVA
jgi:hypothetical protein